MLKLVFIASMTASAANAPLIVTGAHFYAEHTDVGEAIFVTRHETAHIPYIPLSSCYRWTIDVKAVHGLRALKERFTLPATPERWGGVDGDPESPTRLTAQRKVAVTDLMVPLDRGHITNGWCVAAGDPRGTYKIEGFDGKTLLRRFDFTVG